MNEGKKFEEDWKKSIPDHVYYFRIRDPAQSFGNKSSNTRFSLKNPFDMIMFDGDRLMCLELKSIASGSFPLSMIKDHQIESLSEANQYHNVIAGLILNNRDREQTYFLSIIDFVRYIENTEKKSINICDIVEYNGIMVDAEKKRTRYTYDISLLLKRLDKVVCLCYN